MPLRLAHAQDLPAITAIYAAAFYDEEMMGALMHPHRKSFPEDYRRYWANKVAEWYWDYSHQLVVTYTLDQRNEGGREILTGVGSWIRHGEGWERYWGIWGKWDPRNLIKTLVHLRHQIYSYWYPNRAADPEMHRTVATVFSYTKHLWSGRRGSGWYLNFLGVDPAYQRQGYGRLMAMWGVEQAKHENITASVISGTDRDRFYRRCGFEVMGGHVSDGEGNPLRGKTEGGSILFYDPKVD